MEPTSIIKQKSQKLAFQKDGIFCRLLSAVSYDSISTRYIFPNSKTYENIGVLWFRKILLATPLRLFNTKLRLAKKCDLAELKDIRKHIASAEVSHWVGVVTMLAVTGVAWWYRGSKIGLANWTFNILGNLYPCLLQQYNKRRISHLIAAREKRDAAQRVSSQSIQSIVTDNTADSCGVHSPGPDQRASRRRES